MKITHVLGSSIILAALTIAPAAGANDMFLQLDGIQGESTDREFRDAIVINDFTFGVSNATAPGSGAGGKAVFDAISVTKRVDRATLKLFAAAAAGRAIPNATLTARKSNSGIFYRMKLTDATISSLKQAASSTEVIEHVTLSFGAIEIEYFMQDAKGGLTPVGKTGWDVKRNTAK